ncbi:hypothetical protein K490DRAFT_32166 [Saccharata proteae CBS 121410]|uniref:Inositolphosphotransferase Aur1/Ipt1 domain-containing protein n=1 Tax=Saccharata proteae CBS 121410 TaxID=1314787 RepID=A0A9P4I3R0_9PEZI|nr:hypothetical protein K490DRAFT_32166 [Saccharata proteae CBS 121410]
MVASILFLGMYLTRRRNFSIFQSKEKRGIGLLDNDRYSLSTEELLAYDSENEDDAQDPIAAAKRLPKQRVCCGVTVQTPNTSRFKSHFHSRILQKFPFLIEMFYWIINYAFYRMTSVVSQRIFAKTGIWNVAQAHGIAVLETEHLSWMSYFFPTQERLVQQWFMHGHQGALTVLNKAYALIHIPGTVGFLCWYYYVAPSHPTFALARRTMTLTNFLAFMTFIFYPCMPPRLLPKEYGFLDTVRHDDAQSVWMSGKYVNSLAAMPSMHFGYSFIVGVTLVYHSAIFRRTLERGEARKTPFWKLFYLFLGLAYPAFILTVIVATANHYYMDALIAMFYVFIAFACNKVFYVFLPLEDWLLWFLRAEKPIPSTGERFRERGGRI